MKYTMNPVNPRETFLSDEYGTYLTLVTPICHRDELNKLLDENQRLKDLIKNFVGDLTPQPHHPDSLLALIEEVK